MTPSKKELRTLFKNLLSKISSQQRLEKSLKLSHFLQMLLGELLPSPQGELGVFAPLKNEPLWQLSLSPYENLFSFPAFEGERKMQFYKSPFSLLKESLEFGTKILVPSKDQKVFPNILLIPGLAFSFDGARLGRGGGFYDNYLASHSVLKIGVCLKEQLTSSLPEEEHDQRMNYVVSDEGIIKIAEASKGKNKLVYI